MSDPDEVTTIPADITECVGGTRLVRLQRLAPEVEACTGSSRRPTPAGSVKDRIGVAMIAAAEREGRISPGRTTIVEATSGNTGIALAMVCAAKGYDLVLTLPQGMSRERTALLRRSTAPRGRADRFDGRDDRGRGPPPARAGRAIPNVFLRRPVLQSGQPGGPSADHRPGDPRCARRPRRRAGRGGRNRWNDHRRGRGAARAQSAMPDRRGRARELGGAQRPSAGAAPNPGHRRRLRPTRAQPRSAR